MASVGQSRHVRSKPMGDMEPEIINRVTRVGRRLQYELKVMQQPERARACGSGAKSSADRRPVDPPPVVELKIFEVIDGVKSDITFAYNANFFLFATLELARPMAHGRVAAPATQIPVLTGMPVSGMAYLDRPSEAGYFIFPDLSVRHEGKYRLSFNLYEQTNQPEEDGDQEPSADSKPKVTMDSKTQDPESSFDWRMELKSKIFDVFSAKKFPGLAESTHLSRIVAEQGCRVRIRRDVRMRRRTDGKANEDFEEEMEYNRPSRAETVDYQRERSRSSSNVSEADGRIAYDQQRRNSGEYPGQPRNYLGFIGGPQAQQPFATPQPPVQQAHYAPQGPYHPQPQYSQAPPPPPQSQYGPYVHPQSAHPSVPAMRERAYEEDIARRQSMAGHPNEQFPRHPQAQEATFARNPQSFQGYPPMSPAQGHTLPPLKIASDFDSSPPVPLPPARHLASIAPAVHSPTWERREERLTYYADHSEPLVPAHTLIPEGPRNGNKRSYDDTFRSNSYSRPLRNGMRPATPHDDLNADEDDEFETFQMVYKRADGNRQSRALPEVRY